MSQVAALSRHLDIFDDHPLHAQLAVWRAAEILAQFEGEDVRQMPCSAIAKISSSVSRQRPMQS